MKLQRHILTCRSQTLISDYFGIISDASNIAQTPVPHVSNAPILIHDKFSLKDKVNMYYQNVRGLRTKTAEFYNNTLLCDYDIISLTETSLNASFFDIELFDSKQFSVYRSDRSVLNSIHKMYGGVLTAVRTSFPSERIIVPGTDNVEMIITKIHLHSYFLYVCCLYIPSGSSVAVYKDYHDALEKTLSFIDLDPNDEFCVLGDFNLRLVEWTPDYLNENINSIDDLINGQHDSYNPNILIPSWIGEGSKADVIYLLMSGSLHQVNSIVNHYGRILDLVFYTNPNNIKISKSEVPLSVVDLYHFPIEISISADIHENIENNVASTEFNFKKGDFVGLNSYINSIDWSQRLSYSDVDDKVNSLYEILLKGFEMFIPLKKKIEINDPPWYNKRLRNLKNRVSKANKRYKSETNPDKIRDLRLKFLSLSKEFHSIRDQSYKQYLVNTEEMLISDPSKFWSYVKSRKKTSGYPSMMSRGTRKSCNPVETCELFADFFQSVYVTDTGVVSENLKKSYPLEKRTDIGSISLSIDNVVSHLLNIDISKGAGPDNISPIILKNCAESLSSPLLSIFNFSLSTEKFPTRWKESYLIPLFKNGSRSQVENYRGIAILPTFGKLFEEIVTTILTEKLRKVISNAQHGFMKRRSTSTNLVEFVSHATKVMESKHQLDVIYTDFQKAFDRVKHSILLYKLKKMGVHSSLLAWISSYLSGRSQFVKLANWSSRTFSVTSGVPQGSHLGPILFILFMDDATKVFSTSAYLMYADDLKIFKEIKNVLDASALQRDLNRFLQWCNLNELFLNVQKCNVISFTRRRSKITFDYSIDNIALNRVKLIKDLGVLLDEKLTFSKHVEYVIAKSYSMLGFLMRTCKQFTNILSLKNVYFAYVRSYLEYASVVWQPYQDTFVNRIESIQKKFVMYALRRTVSRDVNFKLPPYSDRCESINIESLARRRVNACALFTSDVLNGNIDAPNIARKITFNIESSCADDFLVVDSHRTNYGQNEPINNMCIQFNRFSQFWSLGIKRSEFKIIVRNLKIPIKLNGKIKLL